MITSTGSGSTGTSQFPGAAFTAAAARYWQQQDWLNSPYRKYTPWALADAARVSLALGNEYRRMPPEQDLLQVLNAYSRFDDPFLRDKDAHAFLLRMAGQQMTWQVPEYETVARTAAMFEQTRRCSRWSACGPAGTPSCSLHAAGVRGDRPARPGPARSAARDASTRRCSRPRTAS